MPLNTLNLVPQIATVADQVQKEAQDRANRG